MTNFRRVAPWFLAGALIWGSAYAGEVIQSLDSIRAAAQAYVMSHVPKQAPGKLVVSVGHLDSRLRLTRCGEDLEASLPPGATFRTRMTVAVSCRATPTWTVYVPVSVQIRMSVLVLRRPAARGARLTAADVEPQPRLVSGTGDGYLTDVSELAGRTLKRPLAAGAALTVDAMVDDPVIHRGQRVTLLAEAGGLQVRAAGLALGDAPAAGRVKVQNLSSHRIVEGVVESANVIRVTP